MFKPPKWLIKFIGNIYINKYFPYIVYKPQLHKVKGGQVRKLLNAVREGDLIFRRHNGYLSSMLIPGVYSHVGLCISSQRIVHSIGNGVVNEDIITFCRTDSIALVHPQVRDIDISVAIERALKMVLDKVKYDYEFKADNGSVYCTEMVNICFGYIFDKDYKEEYGNLVLAPDRLLKSRLCKTILEFKN